MRAAIVLFVPFVTAYSGSSIDASFLVYRMAREIEQVSVDFGPGVAFYRNALRNVLYSSCDFYPSDSHKASLEFKKCPPLYATLSAVDRFYKEPNAGELGLDILRIKDKNYYYDLPGHCSFF